MGFADISIAEVAADYQITVEQVFDLCQHLGITYKSAQTRLPLEDAKAIISLILSARASSHSE
ncbi:translation initiation factor IF-2 [Merismopedia glauca]|uniref:Translation initiation factor IF-2 n=1 Tax=Merismopedia glauca CCAP 1448/3 TaxID=1296344 RepID=A0A2T1C111_9CYAN|nr:translation initiation factor IF-2 [Merismopedia glauca]PSB01951.1 translation initiation factor IF-2 [Merismopedia glauca CCAP 1448/3]